MVSTKTEYFNFNLKNLTTEKLIYVNGCLEQDMLYLMLDGSGLDRSQKVVCVEIFSVSAVAKFIFGTALSANSLNS